MENQPVSSPKHILKARVREFVIPPIRDGLILGKHSPIGCVAIRKALELLGSSPFVRFELEDEVISDIVVRQAILRRIPKESLIAFVLNRIKPLIGPEEILHLELEVEVLLEEEFQ
ncbi:MAG: hypothetical protein HY347_08150 [candidate division NC10 bacterium]|nr:hypothetical protein [candidate division NC10 bacterium]